ncbi:MAG: acyl-CoA synthetase FdrA [Nitrospinota bacterium]|nr:MAG: acyl-CoA synthetase FdrA [Nitrospinota bacterium]
MYRQCTILPGTYYDSVVLMQVAQALESFPGVQRAAVMMGTPQNKTLLQEAHLLTPEGEKATANDLLLCVRATTPSAATEALQEALRRLRTREERGRIQEAPPRTLEAALRRMPEANLVSISIPGQYARYEASKAIRHGLHVFLFSDHVDLDTEEELKRLAAQQGVLVMGPDCGTAIIRGVPLGFAHQVARGPVGLVSASGTGLQQVICLLSHQGIGISQAIGVGGRDLHQRIGGQSMRAALQTLGQDRETEVLVLISKPPAPAVAASLLQDAAQIGKPCVIAFLGNQTRHHLSPPLYPVSTLEEAAQVAGALARGEPLPNTPPLSSPLRVVIEESRARLQPAQRSIRALYCGGTLAYEALWLLRRALGTVQSNLDHSLASPPEGHIVLDLGAEEFTTGRPHPMIDPAIRRQHLLAVAQQPDVAVVLCDVLLGWGAHPAPGTALAEAWQEAQAIAHRAGHHLIGIATVCRTREDPQGYEEQYQVLQDSGLILAESNAQAVRLALLALGAATGEEASPGPTMPVSDAGPPPPVPAHLPALLAEGPRVINLGLELFATPLQTLGVPVIHVDWRPPAGGDPRLLALLERLR